MDWEFLSPEERLIAEQAILNYRELGKVCREAEDGHVLNVCESLAVDQGRELTRKTVETILNEQAIDLEKKKR